MAMGNPRDSFIFYRSFFDGASCLPDDQRLALYDAIAAKALYGADPDSKLDGAAMGMYLMALPQLEANQKRYEDGLKGGRPKTSPTETRGLVHEKPKKTSGFVNSKPNVNENVNENVNVNITPLPPFSGGECESKETSESGESLEFETATGRKAPPGPAKKSSALSVEQRKQFEAFWAVWPRKVSRGQAEITWGKLRPDKDLLDKIIAGVDRAKKQDRRFLSAEYTPHASTWLNSRGWEDEYTGGGKGGDARDAPSYDLEEFKRQTAYSVPKF